MTFTTENWDTPQQVTVKAEEDGDTDDEEVLIRYSVSGGDYGVYLEPQTVLVADDDSVGITVDPETIEIDEEDDASFTVVLNSQPTGDVTVTLTLTGTHTDLNLDMISLMFTAENWDRARTVTLTAGDDSNRENEVAGIDYTASGGGYGSVTHSQVINVTDNDGPSVEVDVSADTIAEGGATSTLEFSLDETPASGTVIITPTLVMGSTGEAADYTLTDASSTVVTSITLDASNSYMASITVTAADDSANENEETIELEYDIGGTAANVSPPGQYHPDHNRIMMKPR